MSKSAAVSLVLFLLVSIACVVSLGAGDRNIFRVVFYIFIATAPIFISVMAIDARREGVI